MIVHVDFGDGSPPAGTLIPWYRPDDPGEEWAGWEICEEAAGVLGQDRWIIYRNGQTSFGDGPFQVRVISQRHGRIVTGRNEQP